MTKILEGKTERIIQTQRTDRGVCARCGEAPKQHSDGNCADGKGTYTWAYTREGMATMKKNLEALMSALRKG